MQHWTVLIIFPLILQTIITAQIMFIGREGPKIQVKINESNWQEFTLLWPQICKSLVTVMCSLFVWKVRWWYFIIYSVFWGMDLSYIEVSMAQNWWRHYLVLKLQTQSFSCAGFCALLVYQNAIQQLQWQLIFAFLLFSLWCGSALVQYFCTAIYDILPQIGLLGLLRWLSMALVGCFGIPLYAMPSENMARNWISFIIITTNLEIWIIQ